VILQLIVQGIGAVLAGLIGLLPAGESWSPDVSAVEHYVGMVHSVNAYFPVDEIFVAFGVAMVITQTTFVYQGAMWVYRRIRG
jgi:hypothetical protein